jgi:hypothetical protein
MTGWPTGFMTHDYSSAADNYPASKEIGQHRTLTSCVRNFLFWVSCFHVCIRLLKRIKRVVIDLSTVIQQLSMNVHCASIRKIVVCLLEITWLMRPPDLWKHRERGGEAEAKKPRKIISNIQLFLQCLVRNNKNKYGVRTERKLHAVKNG